MGRRYIGIELGEHAVTHCVPRLRKVIEGEQGGISARRLAGRAAAGSVYRLGEPVFDEQGRITPALRFPHLAAHVWFSGELPSSFTSARCQRAEKKRHRY